MVTRYLILLQSLLVLQGRSQAKTENLDSLLLNVSFSGYAAEEVPKKKFIDLRNKSLAVKINPLTYVSGGLLLFYQAVLSEQIQADCNYLLSCSAFTKTSMEKLGLLRGFLVGINQLSNCFHTVYMDHAPYKVNSDFKVINYPEPE